MLPQPEANVCRQDCATTTPSQARRGRVKDISPVNRPSVTGRSGEQKRRRGTKRVSGEERRGAEVGGGRWRIGGGCWVGREQ